ncbi:MAG: hypothetical protein HZB86_12645 [Deltaproteobacteria bacterium]|nr:hypothetical protein [Deltaproteobacteria bacterium]
MTRIWIVILGALFLVSRVSAGEPPALETPKDKVSYATGVDMVRSFQRQGVEVDRDLFLKGVTDGLSAGALLMSDDEINKSLKLFQAQQKMKQAERKQKLAEKKAKQRQNATTIVPGSTAPVLPDKQRP